MDNKNYIIRGYPFFTEEPTDVIKAAGTPISESGVHPSPDATVPRVVDGGVILVTASHDENFKGGPEKPFVRGMFEDIYNNAGIHNIVENIQDAVKGFAGYPQTAETGTVRNDMKEGVAGVVSEVQTINAESVKKTAMGNAKTVTKEQPTFLQWMLSGEFLK